MLVALLATRSTIASRAPEPGRLACICLGVELLAAAAVTSAMIARFAAPAADRCESGPSFTEVAVVVSTAVASLAGGVAIAALAAAVRQRGRVHAWHVAAGVAVVVVPLAAFVEAVVFGLTCSGR